VAAAAAALGGG